MTKKERYQQVLSYFQHTTPIAETELFYDSPFQLLVAVILSAQCTDKRVNLTTPDIFKKYPLLSSSIEGDKIIIKKNLNIGMATSLPNGNLIVPVIKNADQLNLVGLTKQVNGLANAARTGKLRPDDTSDGTFTLTNIGTFGSIMGTPIINQPQVAIMAVGVIKKRPMVIETQLGDSIAIRHMMYISLSYDHRIIDGALGSIFLNAVSKELEEFDINRSF